MSRAYRLRLEEPLREEIVRVAVGRIDHALDELRGDTDSSPEQAVHEARKDMKKLRALLRLVGDKAIRREAAVFRDAARELAGLRDADVMLATLDRLEAGTGPLRQALEAHRIRTAGGAHGPASGAATAMLEEARERVAGWPLEGDGFAEGLLRSYRRGRRAWRTARKEPSTENLHEWRKRVKDLWYHLSLLEEAWKPVMTALSDEAHELSDRLGDDHDLAVLLEWASEHAPDSADLEPLVAGRRRELQHDAFVLGARLYADKPRAFVGRVERWWQASARAASAEPAQHQLG
jgi:CHAD domain-containing protein